MVTVGTVIKCFRTGQLFVLILACLTLSSKSCVIKMARIEAVVGKEYRELGLLGR